MSVMGDVFSDHLEAWRDYAATPWSRSATRWSRRPCAVRRPGSAPGCGFSTWGVGDGRDALPLARAGHDVTILDRSARWLEEAQQRAAESGVAVSTVVGDLTIRQSRGSSTWCSAISCCSIGRRTRRSGPLAAGVRPGGFLSVMVPNPASMVLRRLVVDGPAAALAELWADTGPRSRSTRRPARSRWPDLEAALEATGLRISARYGTRVASDLLTDDDRQARPRVLRGAAPAGAGAVRPGAVRADGRAVPADRDAGRERSLEAVDAAVFRQPGVEQVRELLGREPEVVGQSAVQAREGRRGGESASSRPAAAGHVPLVVQEARPATVE